MKPAPFTYHRPLSLAETFDPPGDIHGSPALRRHLARVLLARVVSRLVETGS